MKKCTLFAIVVAVLCDKAIRYQKWAPDGGRPLAFGAKAAV